MADSNSNNTGQNFYTPPNVQTSDAEAFAFNFSRMLNSHFFIELVRVVAVKGAAPNLTVDVLPLVTQTDQSGAMIDNSTIFGCPVFRLQRGASAIIMDPVPGDIGMIAVCDQDITIARTAREPSVPGSKRKHSKGDALYLGGFLNAQPSEFVRFNGNQIDIVTPGQLTVNAPSGVTMTTPELHVTGNITAGGNITDNSGTQGASLKALRDAYDLHKHPVPNVQSGSSTATSNTTDHPV